MLSIIIVITSITQIILALLVYLKRRNNLTNILFALLSLSTLAWVLANYAAIGILQSPSVIYAARIILFCVVIQNTMFYLFARTFPDSKWRHSKKGLGLYLGFSVFAALATLSPFVFTSAVLKNGQPSATAGPGIMIFIAHAGYSIGFAFTSLLKKLRRSHGTERNQLRLLVLASVLNWAVVPLTNFIFTLAFQTTIFIKFSPIYTLLFSGMIAYTIISQKLFDIRAVVARSVAYVLLVGTVALVYSASLFGLINLAFAGADNEVLRQLLSIILVFPIALMFQPIKRYIDQLTNRIFFRDSYDSQLVLNQLGKVIVAEIDLHKVLNSTRTILSDAIKSSYIEFMFFKEGKPYLEVVQSKALEAHLGELAGHLQEQPRPLLITESLGAHNPLKPLLTDSEVAVCMHLKTQNQTVGYVLFGEKKNGDIYNSQDLKFLRIVANELAVAVQNALRFEQIEEFNLTLQQKVDDATRQLRHTNDKLRKLDETKDDFISMASHQLRTPLTSVKGYVSMVLEGDAGKITAQQRKLLNQSFISSQRMVYLIADLLNVSRLKTGKFVIEAAPTNLADVVESEIEQLRETAKGRDLKLEFNRPKSFPSLNLDETKIRQVIMNFTDNAIYYTPSGGTITVNLEDKPESVELTVLDNGIGVPKAEQHHLFNKFYRAGNAKKARPDGTGLGLFMAQKVVVAQGGAIIFHSEENKGSTFGFSFPKAKLLVK